MPIGKWANRYLNAFTLAELWKKASVNFLRRFDWDGNGEVDMDEWERARAQARLEVLQKKGVLGGEDV